MRARWLYCQTFRRRPFRRRPLRRVVACQSFRYVQRNEHNEGRQPEVDSHIFLATCNGHAPDPSCESFIVPHARTHTCTQAHIHARMHACTDRTHAGTHARTACTAPPYTAPHRTTLHRTAPHRTTPHRTRARTHAHIHEPRREQEEPRAAW